MRALIDKSAIKLAQYRLMWFIHCESPKPNRRSLMSIDLNQISENSMNYLHKFSLGSVELKRERKGN